MNFKIFAILFSIFITLNCSETLEVHNDEYLISGKVLDKGNLQSIDSAMIILRQNMNPGFLNYPSYRHLDTAFSNYDGSFEFTKNSIEYLSLIVSKHGYFEIDGIEYMKYIERYIDVSSADYNNMSISLTPQAILEINFVTDDPLSGDETFSIYAGWEGSNYSATRQVPSLRRFELAGNTSSKINWSVKREGQPVQNFTDTINIPSFQKKEYTINY